MRKLLEHKELCLGVMRSSQRVWVRIKKQTSTGDVVAGVCYRLPDLEEQSEALCRQLEAASYIHPHTCMGMTALKNISNTGGSWRALMITFYSKW